MSLGLPTPLNSILIVGQQLTDSRDGNLSLKQVEFARTIHGAGTDLLNLISDILDLSKIESGTVTVDAEEILFSSLLDMVARPFRHEAETRQLSFDIHVDQDVGRSIVTDAKRLQQVLKNLLSNAFKFTEQGGALPFADQIAIHAAVMQEHPVEGITDDRLDIQPGDNILLVVEDDPHYARIMVDLARDDGFKVLVATRGADAIDLARQFQPTAI